MTASMTFTLRPPLLLATRSLALGAALAAVLALAVARGSERFGGLVPCALCLLERWPYRVAAVLALCGCVLPARGGRAMLWLVVLAGLAAAGLAGVHVGVEQHWWPSPLPECAAPRFSTGGSFAQRLASMPSRPEKPCDDPTFLLPGVPVSMAALNLLYALGLSVGVGVLIGARARRGTGRTTGQG